MKASRTTNWLLGANAALFALFVLLAVTAHQVSRRAGEDGATISADALPGSVAAQTVRVAASHCARHLVIAAVTEDPAVRAASLRQAKDAEAELIAAVE